MIPNVKSKRGYFLYFNEDRISELQDTRLPGAGKGCFKRHMNHEYVPSVINFTSF